MYIISQHIKILLCIIKDILNVLMFWFYSPLPIFGNKNGKDSFAEGREMADAGVCTGMCVCVDPGVLSILCPPHTLPSKT